MAVQGAADFANAGRQCAAGGNGLNDATHDQWGCLKLLLALAEVQSRIDFPDVVGRTALHLAAEIAGDDGDVEDVHAEGVQLLLAAGASPHAIDQNGQTPLDLAKKVGTKAWRRFGDI